MQITIGTVKSLAAASVLGVLALGTAGAAGPQKQTKFYNDDPLWREPRPLPVKDPAVRKLSDYYDFFENSLFHAGERAPRKDEYLPSAGINTVDEAPDSAWYTNRHASKPMSAEELKRGPGDSNPPAEGKWMVVAAKNEGVTPGFRIRDTAGREYLLKFDPLTNPEMASAADVITSKFFYALGYNVPENYVVYFERSRIVIEDGAMLKDGAGRKREVRKTDVDEMLLKVPRGKDGNYRALASMLISGKPLGPFRYQATRSDDPNDIVAHENRRDLRGLRTFCAWLGHDDSKALNTLDVLTSDDGVPYIKHYLIDFGASLGSASFMANSPRDGNVYLFDWKTSAVQFFTFGAYAPGWQRAEYPKLPSVGRFEYKVFDPERWVPDYPNTAFRNENPADRVWAARKVAAFTDGDIRAMVSTGRYSDPAAEEWVVRCLIERRNKILKAYLEGMGGLDGFEVRGDELAFRGVGPHAASPSAIQVAWSEFDNKTGRTKRIADASLLRVPRLADGADYVVADLSGAGGPEVSVYVRARTDYKIVGIERRFAAMRQGE